MGNTAFHAGSTGSNPVRGIRENAGSGNRTPTLSPTPRTETPARKHCPGCLQERPGGDFCRDRTRSDGLQSTCKHCKRRYQTTEEQRRKAIARSTRYRENNPEAKRAQRKLGYAIESGRMTRGFCECCGSEKTDAHHWRGYDYPLDVQWLCRSCHVQLEPRRGAA
jgi:hypothetical protein